MQATSNIEFKYNGKVYQAVPAISRGRCYGCAFERRDCVVANATAMNEIGETCATLVPYHAIWQEKVDSSKEEHLTFTMKDIEFWYSEWVDGAGLSNDQKQGLLEIKRDALMRQDPEYQEYLRALDAKFEVCTNFGYGEEDSKLW